MLARIVKAQKSAAAYGPALYGTDLDLTNVIIETPVNRIRCGFYDVSSFALQLGTAALHREGMIRPGKHFRVVERVADDRDLVCPQRLGLFEVINKNSFMC